MIRLATPDDASAIADVHTRTWQHAYRGLVAGDVLDNISVNDRAKRWFEILTASDSDATILVDSDGDVVRGFVSVGPSRDEDGGAEGAWEIYAIYVDPANQRQGRGNALLHAGLASVPMSVGRTTLWVLAGNSGARQFYESVGFQADGTSKSAQIGADWLPEVRYEFVR